MRSAKGGARRWARWSTLALLAGIACALVLRTNVALLSTQGTSMAPRFHTGDLAVTFASSDYDVGDIVAYRATPEGQTVLHRIIEKTGDRYRFKGDNNSWVDPVNPHTDDLVGKLWLRVPKAGALINLRSSAWQLGMLTVAAVLLFGGGAAHRRRRRRTDDEDGARKPPRRVPPVGDLAAAFGLPAAAVLVSLLLAAVSFHRPASSETTASREYSQTVRYGYTASAPSGTTYPDGVVTTGSPIFLRLVSSLKFQLTYDVAAASGMVHNAGGTYSIEAVVAGPAAWRRTIPLQPATPFTGESFSTEVAVDIPQIREIVAANAAETGVKGDAIVVSIVPNVSTNGFIDGAPFATTFAKGLTMELGPTTVTLSTQAKAAPAASTPGGDMMQTGPTTAQTGAAGPSADQLTATETAEYRAPVVKANRFELFSRRLDVSRARLMSGAALLMALVWLAVVAASQDRLRQRSEATRITHRYRERIVGVTSLSSADHIVDVAAIGALVRIAEQGDRFIMHLRGLDADGASDMFVVDDDGTRYRYLTGPEPELADLPPPTPVVDSTARNESATDRESEPGAPTLTEPEPTPAPGLIVASGDGSDADIFRALLGTGLLDDRPPLHDPGTPPPFVAHDPGSPPPFVGVPPAVPPAPPSLDQAIRLTPLTDAERSELGLGYDRTFGPKATDR